ncbi:MAG: hypothetical protein JW722_06455 [Demequinaceae bacterium]|nr:hypothetical protein [Demequinaceae bacterium]
MGMFDLSRPMEAVDTTALKPARFKLCAGRLLKAATLPHVWGEIGSAIDVTFSSDEQREGWDDWIAVVHRGRIIGWVSAEGEQTRSQLRAIRDHGFEVVATAVFEDIQGVLSLRIYVPKTAALTSWLEWHRPT